MNKHILLVMKWLNDKDSVSQKELDKNSRDAWTDACVAYAAATAYYDNYIAAAYWVKEYFLLYPGEDRNEYEKELEK